MITKNKIAKMLTKNFLPIYFLIEDDSASHARHREALQSGGGHFSMIIVSQKFAGQKMLERHRMIYKLLKPFFKKDIHALAIQAFTPDEFAKR